MGRGRAGDGREESEEEKSGGGKEGEREGWKEGCYYAAV